MNELLKVCIDLNKQILRDTMTSVKIDVPKLDLDKIVGSNGFTFNPFK